MSHFSVCVIVPDDGVVNNIHEGGYLEWHLPMCARPSLPLRGLRSR